MDAKILNLYLDTSVFGGYHDIEFEEETKVLFEKIRLGQFIIMYSDITESELSMAPKKVRTVSRLTGPFESEG